MKTSPRKIIVFCHLHKTAGTAVVYLLQRNLGLGHLRVGTNKGGPYDESALRWDLRINPLMRSTGGHSYHPHVDFGALVPRMVWYTFLRHPVGRCISAYQHDVERKGYPGSLEEFMQKPFIQDQQVRALAGEPDLDAARELLERRFRFVGLQERFDESLLLMRHLLDLGDFNLSYERPINAARSGEVRQRIMEQRDRFEPVILEHNLLDLALYDWVVKEIYPRQVAEYGPQRLQRDLEREFGPYQETRADRLRLLQCRAFRLGVYLPFVKAFGRYTHPLLKR
jgi:hypothetical protein